MPVPAYRTSTMPPEEFKAPKNEQSMSLSHTQFPNHFGTAASVSAAFMPSFVKLDKQVSRHGLIGLIGVAILCLL